MQSGHTPPAPGRDHISNTQKFQLLCVTVSAPLTQRHTHAKAPSWLTDCLCDASAVYPKQRAAGVLPLHDRDYAVFVSVAAAHHFAAKRAQGWSPTPAKLSSRVLPAGTAGSSQSGRGRVASTRSVYGQYGVHRQPVVIGGSQSCVGRM